MKSKILVFSLSLILSLSIFEFIPVKADAYLGANTVFIFQRRPDESWYVLGFQDSSITANYTWMGWYVFSGTFLGYSQPVSSFNSYEEAAEYLYSDNIAGFAYSGSPDVGVGPESSIYVYIGNVNVPGDWNNVHIATPPTPPDPPEPVPGSSWLLDMWEWFLWQLGLNDDYSGDIDAYITGGDRESFEMVTPSPTPSPTPIPSPTPYSLDIIDNNGNPVYTITGIPGSTYNITNTTNNKDGSDFDIFEVDLQIGDGGSTNPRDGLNDVMDTSLSYLSDPENVDMQPVGDSFSIIPSDWFLLLGVVACFPFIAGFISKLLK